MTIAVFITSPRAFPPQLVQAQALLTVWFALGLLLCALWALLRFAQRRHRASAMRLLRATRTAGVMGACGITWVLIGCGWCCEFFLEWICAQI